MYYVYMYYAYMIVQNAANENSGERRGRSWRDSSAVKNTGSFSRGTGFNSQNPHSSSQLSIINPFGLLGH